MPGSPTPILGLTVPTDGGDSSIWGAELNTDLGILDKLAATPVFSASSNYAAVISPSPETYIRVTTGASTITVTVPAPSSSNARKIYTVEKVDSSSGQANIVPAAPSRPSTVS